MKTLTLISLLITISLQVTTIISMIPPRRYMTLFSNFCRNPELNGLMLSAVCLDSSNEEKNAYINFSICAENIEGNLSPNVNFVSRFYIRNCNANSTNLNCECQQPDMEYKSCTIALDDIIGVINGQLFCH